ncbi:N-acetylmuramoyl-L-alanine amidase family protein [Aureibacter tunicatorum]|uniref:N-acetylmuramoyl-L-alanine amidase n=1 Tax=Aureibacter tunicatorum TaxID=866807 RepID=A0AAE3XLY9_9BACT|nr:N-acetylmuramoyl-L-alanine amidase [Aureibacter tunicatorum]MDR6238409.1 N-acetylmuramoyl-L-alanine amidase [Aureibacter tunicatorum]
MKRYSLDQHNENYHYFLGLNRIKSDHTLDPQKKYLLPILKYKYNGFSVKKSAKLSGWSTAEAVIAYNDELHEKKVKKSDFIDDKELWVPYHLVLEDTKTNRTIPEEETIEEVANTSTKKAATLVNHESSAVKAESTINSEIGSGKIAGNFPIFGPKHARVPLKSQALKGCVYYIVSGHGGPDPGSVYTRGKFELHEDEYAYDVALRLARNLLSHGAKAYVIIRDPNDGIRSGNYLKPSKDEKCWPNLEIPRNQLERLEQRKNAVNQLYDYNKSKGYKYQRLICLHIDSREKDKRIDMFFYHQPSSSKSKVFTTSLQNTIRKKYEQRQKGRGYNGIVKARDLFMLRESKPVATFIELGNIQNIQDQRRILPEDNRQAIANWLTTGLLQKK